MNSVSAIVSNPQEVGVFGAAHDAVEINDGIKGATPANPSIDLVAYFRLGVAPAGVAAHWRDVVARHDRDTDDFQSPRSDARDNVLQAFDHLLCACFPADIICAHEQDDVRYPGMG